MERIAGAGQTPGVQDRLKIAQHHRRAIGLGKDIVDIIGAGSVDHSFGDALAGMGEQTFGFIAEQFGDIEGHRIILLIKLFGVRKDVCDIPVQSITNRKN